MNDNKYFDNFDFGDWNTSNIKTSRKVPICLVVDSSGSMTRKEGDDLPKIEQLNDNISMLINFISNDKKARRICDLSIISFGGRVNVISGYTDIETVKFKRMKPNGTTPMGEAVSEAINMLNIRRQYYKDHDIEHYKPIMLLMTDGEPNDSYLSAASQLSQMVRDNELKVFPVGVGNEFNKDVLAKFSPFLEPKMIKDASGFTMLFKLLSSSSSNPNDDSLERWFNDEF